MPEMCDVAGQCLCRPEFTGPRCEQCRSGFHSYPNCHGETRTVNIHKESLSLIYANTLSVSIISTFYPVSQCALVTLTHLWTPAVVCLVSVTADPTTVAPNVTSVHPDTTLIPAAHVSHMTLITVETLPREGLSAVTGDFLCFSMSLFSGGLSLQFLWSSVWSVCVSAKHWGSEVW